MIQNKNIVVIAHNIRSALNVGSIFRICDAVGVNKLYLTGYTPYPKIEKDKRLNFEIKKTEKKIKKSGLEGFSNIPFEYFENILLLIKTLKRKNYKIVALEQESTSQSVYKFNLQKNTAIIIGNEVTGIEKQVLNLCNATVEIPMYGNGKSLNVAVSLAVCLYILNGKTLTNK